MNKKCWSFLLVLVIIITNYTFVVVHSEDEEILNIQNSEITLQNQEDELASIVGTRTKKGTNKYMFDLGRAYPLDYIKVNTASLCDVKASNDIDFTDTPTEKEEVVNVALGKKITSTRFNGGGYLINIASRANDGDEGTAFISTPVNYTDEDGLTIDLESEYAIKYVNIKSDNKRPRKVYLSNNEDFTDSIEIFETSSGRYDLENGNRYRYARVDFKAAADPSKNHFYVFEVEVYASIKNKIQPTTVSLEKEDDKYVIKGDGDNQYYRYILASGTNLTKATSFIKTKNLDYEDCASVDNVKTSEDAKFWGSLTINNLLDEDSSTICAFNAKKPYVQFDLGKKKSISHIEVVLRQDIMDDRSDLKIVASNDEYFRDYHVIGEQKSNEELPQHSTFVRVNSNPYEEYRYVRIYEGIKKGFLCLADVNVYAKDMDCEYVDALAQTKCQVDVNDTISYRVTDNDIKSKWSGNNVKFDLGYCRDVDGIMVLGTGEINITAYCDSNSNAMSYSDTLSKDQQKMFECNDIIRYINIESVDETMDIYDVRAYSKKDGLIKVDGEVYSGEGEWYSYDLGNIRVIDKIMPCNATYYVSSKYDFSDETEVTGHLNHQISGRYIRTKTNIKDFYVMAYELPKIDIDSGIVTYDTSVFNVDKNQNNIIAKYDNNGKLVSVDKSTSTDGEINTEIEAFGHSKFMVWDSLNSQKPLMPVSGIEKVKSKPYMQLYVAKDGSDENDGSKSSPFATIEKAQEIVRNESYDMKGDIIVNIGEGVYNYTKSLEFTEQDSGKNGYKVIYRGEGVGKTVISGGIPVTNFEAKSDGTWQAYLPELDTVYDLIVNGKKANMAHTENPIYPQNLYSNGYGYANDGLAFSEKDLPKLSNPEDVYIHTTKSWKDIFIRAEKIRSDGENVYLDMMQPFFDRACDNIKMSSFGISKADAYDIQNAYELLDTAGEFYFNKKTHILYYIPKEGENIETANVEIPKVDELVTIHGRGVGNHINNFVIDGISFVNTSDSNRYVFGAVTDQAQMIDRLYAFEKSMVSGAMQIDYADNILIQNCGFNRVTRSAISLGEGVVNSEIKNNIIDDVGDGAIVIGRKWHNSIEKHSYTNKLYDCYGRKPTWVSSGSVGHIIMNKENDILSEGTYYRWDSDNTDINRGIMPWVEIDLLKPYTIDSVEIKTGTYQRNYEVLASNDRAFNTYTVLGSVGTTSRTSYVSGGDSTQKYRYVKIRKTKLEQFQISTIFVRTPDEPFQNQVEELCVGNKIINNYIANTGKTYLSSPSITAFYVADTEICNNTIIDSNYSAISFGWGWQFEPENKLTKNNHIANNYISNFNLAACDGGAIYIMGNQPGMVVENNYIEQTKTPPQNYTTVGLYAESGLKYATLKNNAIDMTYPSGYQSFYPMGFFIETGEYCLAHDNYGTYTTVYDNSSNCSLERLIKYSREKIPDEVMGIKNNSGCDFISK